MTKIKKFEVWSTYFYHGDKRIKLGNDNGMLIWYRRDLSTVLITQRTYEEEQDWEHGLIFTHVPRSKREIFEAKAGLLMFTGKPTNEETDNTDNYFISIGDGWGIGWVNGSTRPQTFKIPNDKPLYCYWINNYEL